jgi:hypothetical protein
MTDVCSKCKGKAWIKREDGIELACNRCWGSGQEPDPDSLLGILERIQDEIRLLNQSFAEFMDKKDR